jgi:uncharacterized delta-60 repeat protein
MRSLKAVTRLFLAVAALGAGVVACTGQVVLGGTTGKDRADAALDGREGTPADATGGEAEPTDARSVPELKDGAPADASVHDDATSPDAFNSKDGAPDQTAPDAHAVADAAVDARDGSPTGPDSSPPKTDAGDAGAIADAGPETAVAATGPSGVLDTSFGGGTGHVVWPGGIGRGVVVDATGRIVVAAETGQATVWRLLPDGTFDPSFGSDGGAWFAPYYDAGPNLSSGAEGLVLDGTGSPKVGGFVETVTTPGVYAGVMAIWGLTPDGVTDTSFGTSGMVATAGPADQGWAIARDGTTGFAAVGQSDTSLIEAITWRVSPSGAPVTSFGGPSSTVTFSNGQRDFMKSVVVDANGSIVAGGQSETSAGMGMLSGSIWRYTSAGMLDTTFNGSGQLILGGAGEVRAVLLDAQGRIVFGGSTSAVAGLVGRLLPSGALDPAFGDGGLSVLPIPNPPAGSAGSPVNAIAIDSVGRIVAAGAIVDGGSYYAAAWRLSSAGLLDTSFANNGVFQVNGTAGGAPYPGDGAEGITIDAHDRPILVGGADLPTDAGVLYTQYAVAVWALTP